MFDLINKNVSRYVSFTQAELKTFNSFLKHSHVPKKSFLLQAGEICHFEAFVSKGCIRKYYLDSNGFEVIIQFAIENNWVSDIASFSDQKPSHLFVETLEDCEILTLSPAAKEELLARIPKFERVFRIMVQRNLSLTQDRLFNTISKSAMDKYLDFLEHYPTIPQRVAQHYIASYLGISAEFLSKVRAKLAKQ